MNAGKKIGECPQVALGITLILGSYRVQTSIGILILVSPNIGILIFYEIIQKIFATALATVNILQR